MMEKFNFFLKKIEHFLRRLSSPPKVGGVYISNLGIQYVGFSGGDVPKTYSFRFPPGVMKDGRIQDKERFKNILLSLHQAVLPGKDSEIIQIVCALPSSLVYTQSFSIPNIGEGNFRESVMLNLQTISPLPPQSSYMSWQTLGEASDKYDLLGAFIESSVIDDFENVFVLTKFRPIAFEFPSLSISRLLSKIADTKQNNELLLQVSSDGVNLSIVRKNKIYFDYFRSWRSVQGENSQISRDQFNQVIVEEVRKVMNFSMSKFKEKIDSVLFVAPGFEDAVKKVIGDNFSISAETLVLPTQGISPLWYVPFGAGIREMFGFGKRDEYINLGKETSENLFFESHILGFVGLWRNVLGIVLGFFFIVLLVASGYLSSQKKSLEGSIILSKSQFNQEELSVLSEKANRFNALVRAFGTASNNVGEWRGFLSEFIIFAEKNNVSFGRIDVASLSSSVQVSATAPNNMSALAFKNALIESGSFRDVVIPLLGVKELDDGSVGFTLTLSFKK